jgi:hypothetical protein
MSTISTDSPAAASIVHAEQSRSLSGLDLELCSRIAKRAMDFGREEALITLGRAGHDEQLFAAQTPVVRWSATVEANGMAVLRVDCDGFSKVSNIKDYASVVRTSAHQLLRMINDTDGLDETAGIVRAVSTREPMAWKTTERSVSVRLTEDPALAAHWRALGFSVIDLFE